MNLFTDHDFGCFADDGFGNLVRLGPVRTLTGLLILLQDELSEFYPYQHLTKEN